MTARATSEGKFASIIGQSENARGWNLLLCSNFNLAEKKNENNFLNSNTPTVSDVKFNPIIA